MKNIAAVILSAGASSRFGSPKALVQFGSQSALSLIVNKAQRSGLAPIYVVVGADADLIRAKHKDFDVQWLVNSTHREHHTSSLQRALSEVGDLVSAVMMFIVDQPLVNEETIQKLVSGFHRDSSKVIRPKCETRGGHPVVIPKEYFAEILDLNEDQSLRDVFFKSRRMLDVEVNDMGAVTDFDTPKDLKRLMEYFEEAQKSDRRQITK